MPNDEELIVVVKRGVGIAFHPPRASHLQARESPYNISHYYTRMIDQLFELPCGLRSLKDMPNLASLVPTSLCDSGMAVRLSPEWPVTIVKMVGYPKKRRHPAAPQNDHQGQLTADGSLGEPHGTGLKKKREIDQAALCFVDARTIEAAWELLHRVSAEKQRRYTCEDRLES